MKRLVAIAILFVVAGCAASLPADPTRMSAEQLREWVKDKNANVSCGVINSPYGRGVMTSVVLDKAVVVNGTITVDAECKVTIQNEARPK